MESRPAVPSDESEIVSNRGITLDRHRHRALAGEELLNVTLTEFRLLEALVREPGRAFTRTKLIHAAVGDDALVSERTIDVHIRAIRKKLGPHAHLIETVRGVGYRFQE